MAEKGNGIHKEAIDIVHRPGLWSRVKDGFAVLFASKIATVGLFIILFWVFVALFAPLLTAYGPNEQDWMAPNKGPSLAHPLGTDELGRDLWARLAYGARVVLIYLPISDDFYLPVGTAIWGVFFAFLIGSTLGLLAGYRGGWVDEVVMRIQDALMSIPQILIYLIIMSVLGSSAVNVVISIAIAFTPGVARLVRGLTLDIRTKEFIRAAETRGESIWHIIFIEIFLNTRGPVIVDAMLRVGYAIFVMGTLGFLGLGVPPPSPDWGSMVAKGRAYIMMGSPWAAIWPSLAIASLVIGLNLLGDGLSEESKRYQ